MSQEHETTPTASAPAVPATSAQASGRGSATPTPRAPREDPRTCPARVGPLYIEHDTMREFERLCPFKGERNEWRSWSLKAKCAAGAAGLERVMTGKSPRAHEDEGIDAVEEWEHKNRRIHTRLVMLLEGAVSGVARSDLLATAPQFGESLNGGSVR